MVNIKKQIAIFLKEVKTKEHPIAKYEQYELDSESASRFVHNVAKYVKKNGKILDAGCGSGMLTIASILSGFSNIIAIDIDKTCIKNLIKNLKKLNLNAYVDFIQADFLKINFKEKIDIIIMNAPFGTKIRHADKNFLIKAFSLSDKIFSLNKEGNFDFFKKIAEKFSFEIFSVDKFKIVIKHTMSFHKKEKYYVSVEQFFFRKINGKK